MKRYPTFIVIVGLWNVIYGALWLVWACGLIPPGDSVTLLTTLGMLSGWPFGFVAFAPNVSRFAIGLISLVVCLSGIGLLMLKDWVGRQLTLFVTGISLLLVLGFVLLSAITAVERHIDDALLSGAALLAYAIPGLVWDGWILLYFLQPSVKAQFVSKGR